MQPLSSGHFSVDDQTADVLSHLSLSDNASHRELSERFTVDFPEYNGLAWNGSWVDTEASEVDADYMSWVREWIDNNVPDVTWFDGEPYLLEKGDDLSELWS